LQKQIALVRGEKENPDGGTTIFHGLIGGDLAASEKTDERMIDESRVILAAGTDTTARALTVITYHLLANPERLAKLKSELDAALPDPDALPRCSQVETLPYLVCLCRFPIPEYGLIILQNAVIQEGLRLHPPASVRQERVAPDEDLHYEDKKGNKYTIPKGVSCLNSFSHRHHR
jgi:cytochrome P450